eukprot:4245159-Lingulodinium_polyedra.AAC.1
MSEKNPAARSQSRKSPSGHPGSLQHFHGPCTLRRGRGQLLNRQSTMAKHERPPRHPQWEMP